MKWKSILAGIAPTLATALGGPLAGMATREIANKVLGVPTATNKDIERAVLDADPAMLTKLRELDQQFEKQMAELGIELEKIEAADRASARERQVALKDHTPTILAFLVIAGFFVIQWYVIGHPMAADTKEIVLRTLGTLDAILMMVFAYYFGSSRGSKAKDDILGRKLNGG